MNEENENIKPKTDLELFLNYANQCVWKNLKNESGAGANAAGSRVDMTYAATDPLSEIVWSPENGLCLKCADSSFAGKNSSLFQDVGPSSMVITPPQIVNTDKPVEDVSVKPIAIICTAKGDIAETDTHTPAMHPTSDSGVMPKCKASEESDTGLPNDQNKNIVNHNENNACDEANIGADKLSGIEGNKFSAISGQVDQRPLDGSLPQSDAAKPSMERNPSPSRCSHEDTAKGSGVPGTNIASSSRGPLEKLESTAENDLRTLSGAAACKGIKRKSPDAELMRLHDKTLAVLQSPCNSKIHMTINKGKEKSLSDGGANVRLSMEDEDSHSSVESCNSGGFFTSCKKRCHFQQQLMIGSKRVKKQIQETSGSKSYAKQDSSFMNWISNMVKGFSQSVQNESNMLALTLANPDHQNVAPDESLIAFNANQDPEPKNTGFKSIFQAIYCPTLKNEVGKRMPQVGEGCEDLEPGNMMHGIEATPITCCAENNKSEASSGRDNAGPSSQPTVKPLSYFHSHESIKNDTMENKNCSILGLSKDKEEMVSDTSATRHNTNNTDNVYSNPLSERKGTDNIFNRSDALRSLWITRFSPKLPAPLTTSERGGSQVPSTNVSKLPNSDKHISYLNNCKTEETREHSPDNAEARTAFEEDSDHKSKHQFIPFSSSSGFRNSEPMASMFAKRLGAIKHIIPTKRTDSTTQVHFFCLFCGTRGHQLADCSDIAESDVEDLQKNVTSYGGYSHRGLEEPPCLCFKCFQSNHWAISCPTSISKRKHVPEVKALVNDSFPTGKHVSSSNEGSARLRPGGDDQIFSSRPIDAETVHQGKRSFNLKRKLNEIAPSMIGFCASLEKYCSSSTEENKFKENPIISPPRLSKRQISNIPKGISEAVRSLRLSRTDILKWISGDRSISNLDGFFLRLRLGKWEEGLGGTGYHVASINEGHDQSSEQNTRKSLSVNVGGIKCMVESQFISNHDFLEEEIMEWWSTKSEADTGVPSEEDLIQKIERKKLLGL
ncbi:uncharacterized protein LOC107643214 isoform X2 [Arachis ipaensis]|uniref:uncharacterized protein LOC107643214 isoform X2 n=1 Tax=Arachis ipaensis TaxID=130454 RepID=UPI0007AEF086|nr:uncharacterized protein LOC107643214 isoform X2 [Arachis ipaensis]